MLQICYSENPKCSGKVACLPRSYGPVQIKIIILQFYTHTFQKAIFYANLWLTYFNKTFCVKKDSNIFNERAKFVRLSSSFLGAFELCRKLRLIFWWLMLILNDNWESKNWYVTFIFLHIWWVKLIIWQSVKIWGQMYSQCKLLWLAEITVQLLNKWQVTISSLLFFLLKIYIK